jgi:hypothetical protein
LDELFLCSLSSSPFANESSNEVTLAFKSPTSRVLVEISPKILVSLVIILSFNSGVKLLLIVAHCSAVNVMLFSEYSNFQAFSASLYL